MHNPITPKRLVAGAAAAVVLVGAVAAAGARSDSGPSYRTATVSTQQVEQVLDAVATVEPVSQASVAFPVAGTADAVDVKVGDAVTVGERLATLDVADLEDAVDEKQAALDQANLTLELALAGEDVGSVSGGGSPSGGFGRPAASGSSAEIDAAQQAVLDAQKSVDESLAAAQAALDAAATVCAAPAVAAPEDTTSTTAGSDDTASCLAALQAVQVAQQQVATDQAALTAAADALTALLEQEASNPETPTTTVPTTPTAPPSGGNGGSATGGTGPDGSSAPGGSNGSNGTDGASTSSSPTAEDLIAYQKKVDAAADELAVALQAVDQATIVSPIAGTVASVGLAVGDDVTAASATQNIVIVGEGGFEVTTSVSVKDLPDIEVGQTATVLPDGDSKAIAGEIVRIGVAADSSTSTTTYPVTIALTGDTSEMGNGSTASVVIVTSAADDALAVPTSAVTVDGDRSTVEVVTDGETKTTTVETGAVGRTWTEITNGLERGDEVVLADLDEPLPGSATDTSSTKGTGQDRQFSGGPMMVSGPPGGVRPGN